MAPARWFARGCPGPRLWRLSRGALPARSGLVQAGQDGTGDLRPRVVRRQELRPDGTARALPGGLPHARARVRKTRGAGRGLGGLRCRADVRPAQRATRRFRAISIGCASSSPRSNRRRRRALAGHRSLPRRGERGLHAALGDHLARLRSGAHQGQGRRRAAQRRTSAGSTARRSPPASTSWWSRRCTTASQAAGPTARARASTRPGRSATPRTPRRRSRFALTLRAARGTTLRARRSKSVRARAPSAATSSGQVVVRCAHRRLTATPS